MNGAPRPLPWQTPHWQRLRQAIDRARLSHALLLAGAAGIGKRRFAEALTAYLLCEGRGEFSCGRCRSCAQLAAGVHPNRLFLAPEEGKRDIGVDAVRETIARVSVSSHYRQAKVVIVDPADQLSLGAVNALLKTLEEPPAATHFLLVCERSRLLPATVRSRAQMLRFATPPREQALAWLAEVAPQLDENALDEAGGAPLRALAWSDAGHLQQRRTWAALLEGVSSRRQSPLAAAAAVGKDDAKPFFEWLYAWSVRQLAASVRQGEAGRAAAFEAIGRHAIDGLRGLAGNANALLSLESTMMVWLQLAARGQRAAAAVR